MANATPRPNNVEVRVVQEGHPDIIYVKPYCGITPNEARRRLQEEESIHLFTVGSYQINEASVIGDRHVLAHGDALKILATLTST